MKKIPRNLLALSSSGFAMIHFCFALRFDASDICFHISGHTLSGLEVVCFLVNLPPNNEHPSGGLSFNTMNLVNLSMRPTLLFLHQRSNNLQYVFRHHI